MSSKQAQQVDILILGGGPGGLSAGLTLARQLHTAVIFNHSEYRNAVSEHMHNVLTWDNANPRDFVNAGRENLLANYQTVRLRDVEVLRVKKREDGLFEAEDREGEIWLGKKLILATGVEDIMVDVPGYKDCWNGKSIFHCLFCHGYECRGSPSAGVLAVDGLTVIPQILHFARSTLRFSKVVTIYTNGSKDLHDGLVAKIGSQARFRVEDRRIKLLLKRDKEVIVQLEDDTEQVESFLAHRPRVKIRGDFAEQLGLQVDSSGELVITPPFFKSSLSGCFISGDLTSPLKIVPNAMLSGAAAGAGACAELQAEEMDKGCLL